MILTGVPGHFGIAVEPSDSINNESRRSDLRLIVGGVISTSVLLGGKHQVYYNLIIHDSDDIVNIR